MKRKSRLSADIGSAVQRERMDRIHSVLGSPPVVVSAGGNTVSVQLAEKMELSKKNLQGMMLIMSEKADEVSEGVGGNWFPCGFANLNVDSDSPIVKLFKKEGKLTQDGTYEIDGIGYIRKNMGKTGYYMVLSIPQRNATEGQSLNYKTPMYQMAQQILARMGVRSSLETMVD